MTFSELTWSADSWNEELESHMGWQAQYESPNGYLLIVNAQLNGNFTPLATGTGTGQQYSCSIYPWNRVEETEATSVEHDCGDNRVQEIIREVEALTLPEVEETTTTTTTPSGPAAQWD